MTTEDREALVIAINGVAVALSSLRTDLWIQHERSQRRYHGEVATTGGRIRVSRDVDYGDRVGVVEAARELHGLCLTTSCYECTSQFNANQIFASAIECTIYRAIATIKGTVARETSSGHYCT